DKKKKKESFLANFPPGRRDYSRSPARRYDDKRDGYNTDRDSYADANDNNYYHHRHRRDRHDYTGMYDDDGGGGSQEEEYAYSNRDRHRYDDDDGRSPPRGRHHRSSYSRSPVRDAAGRPSDTVILEGLPFSVSSSELQESLLRDSMAADLPPFDVRISSSKGSRRAFVQFDSVDSSVSFIREHFPEIQLELAHPTDDVPDGRFQAYIHYARNREDGSDARVQPGSNWTCHSCDFSNYPSRTKCKECGAPPSAPDWQQSLTGMTDAADVPSQILVVYPLASFVDEDMLAADMKRLEREKPNPVKDTASDGAAPKLKSTAPTGNPSGYGARPGSLHRVFLMRNAHSDESFKYGFAEFWALEDAMAAVAKYRASRSFTVAACTVHVSTIHMGVFLPEDRELTPETERMSFNPLFNPALRVRYKDYRVYPSQRVVTETPPGANSQTADKQPAEDDAAKKSKKRKADGAPATQATTAAKKPVVMAGTMAMWQRKHDELHAQGAGGTSSAADAPPPPPVPIKISLSNARIGGGGPTPAIESQRQEESKTPEEDRAPTAGAVSYVDRDRLMCLICMRKYKSVQEVDIHEKSRNHKQATENEDQVKAALPRLAARDKRQKQKAGTTNIDATTESTTTAAVDAAAAAAAAAADADAQQYRDRAKERRQVYNQPRKLSSKQTDGTGTGTPPPPPAAPAPAPSKGAGMLAKMGWSAGAGLGAKGEGRTDIVETHAYQEGVGLGAEGGKLGDAAEVAERNTKSSGSYADYLASAQDKARDRYKKLGG
ncbi:ZnF RBZ, partial [Geosmithia morbida]